MTGLGLCIIRTWRTFLPLPIRGDASKPPPSLFPASSLANAFVLQPKPHQEIMFMMS